MPQLYLFDRTIGLLQKSLDLRMQRQQAISANIANVDTPGYKAVHLEFEDGLKRALARKEVEESLPPTSAPQKSGATEGFEKVTARVVRVGDRSGIGDKNGVNLDQEMISLAENQILYESASQMISKKIALLRYVIQDGK